MIYTHARKWRMPIQSKMKTILPGSLRTSRCGRHHGETHFSSTSTLQAQFLQIRAKHEPAQNLLDQPKDYILINF